MSKNREVSEIDNYFKLSKIKDEMSTEFGGDGQKVAEVSICRRCVRLWIGKSVILT